MNIQELPAQLPYKPLGGYYWLTLHKNASGDKTLVFDYQCNQGGFITSLFLDKLGSSLEDISYTDYEKGAQETFDRLQKHGLLTK